MTESQAFLESTIEPLRPLRQAFTLADREAAQAATRRCWADPERYAAFKRLLAAGAATGEALNSDDFVQALNGSA